MNTSTNVIKAIVNELFVDMLESYKKNLLSEERSSKRDVFYAMKDIFLKLSEVEKNDFLQFIKLVMADSLSTVFGMIDGTTFIGTLEGDFVLLYDGKEIQGNLQDLFLEEMENEHVY